MTMMPRRAGALLILLLMVGCGPSRPRLYPVTGTVTYKDQPVAGAQVTFVSAEGRPAQGTTDAAGKFRGIDRFACRERILKDLKQDGLLEKIEPYSILIGHCYR